MFSSVGELLKSLFLYLDKVVYRLMGNLYELFIEISSISFFSNDTINEFSARVYGLLAIFMLFRISFSILTYIVNPDSINDKTAGAGKLIGNFLITIIMLISVPWVFRQAMNLQKTILQENIIGKIILGVSNNTASYQFGAGYEMGWTTFSAFFYPNVGRCNRSNLDYVDYKYDTQNACCQDMGNDQCTKWYHLNVGKYVNAVEGDVVNAVSSEGEVYEYNYGVSTLAGILICYILLLFCIQIAVRSVKLGFLQLIAPIPIISYIDPKHGKDGMFKKWLSVCGKTYADIFIRLAAIYFALFIISEIGQTGSMTNTITNQPAGRLAKVLIIMGALMFAKDLPKFIEEITGIKLDGGFSLNPFKNNPFLGAAAGGLIGAGLGTVGALTGGGAFSGVTGAFRGMSAGIRGKKIGEIASGQTGANARMREARANGSTFWGRRGAAFSNLIGSPGAAGKLEQQDKQLDDEIKQQESLHSSFDGIKSQISSAIEAGKLGSYSDNYKQKLAAVEAAKIKRDAINRADFTTEADYNAAVNNAAMNVVEAENAASKYLKKDAISDYYTAYRNGTLASSDLDSGVARAFSKYDTEARANGITADVINDYNKAKTRDDQVSDHLVELQNEKVKIRDRKAVASANKAAVGKK